MKISSNESKVLSINATFKRLPLKPEGVIFLHEKQGCRQAFILDRTLLPQQFIPMQNLLWTDRSATLKTSTTRLANVDKLSKHGN